MTPPVSFFDTPQGRRAFWLLWAGQLAVGVGNSMLTTVMPPLARHLALPDIAVGLVFSLSAVLWVVSSPLWGRASDSRGRKPVIVFGFIAFTMSMLSISLVALAGDRGWLGVGVVMWALILSRAIYGGLGSAASPAAQAYVADNTPMDTRVRDMAALGSAFAIGQAAGPALAGAILGSFGLLAPLVAMTAAAALGAFAVWRFLPESTAPRTLRDQSIAALWRLAWDARVAPFMIVGLAMSVTTAVLAQTTPFVVMDRLGVSGVEGAQLVAAAVATGALAQMAAQLGIIPRLNLGPRMLIVWGAGLIACAAALTAIGTTLGAFIAAQMLIGLGFGLARPGFAGGASMSVEAPEQGAVAGLLSAVSGAGFVLSPFLGIGVYELVGHAAPFWLAAALMGVTCVFALRSRRLRAVEAKVQELSQPGQEL